MIITSLQCQLRYSEDDNLVRLRNPKIWGWIPATSDWWRRFPRHRSCTEACQGWVGVAQPPSCSWANTGPYSHMASAVAVHMHRPVTLHELCFKQHFCTSNSKHQISPALTSTSMKKFFSMFLRNGALVDSASISRDKWRNVRPISRIMTVSG